MTNFQPENPQTDYPAQKADSNPAGDDLRFACFASSPMVPASSLDRERLRAALSSEFTKHFETQVKEELTAAYEELARALGKAPSIKEVKEHYRQAVNFILARDPWFIGPLTEGQANGKYYSWSTYRTCFGTLRKLQEAADVPLERKEPYSGKRSQPQLSSLNTIYFPQGDCFVKIGGDPLEIEANIKLGGSDGSTEYKRALVEASIPSLKDVLDRVLTRFPSRTKDNVVENLYDLVTDFHPGLRVENFSRANSTPTENPSLSVFANLQKAREVRNIASACLVGQDEAVDTVCSALEGIALWGRSNGLRGSMLLLGPSGVGKTELTKIIARVYLGESSRMLRIDCSEYALPHEHAKLIGSPPGYIGHSEAGILTQAHGENPERVLLFDELEKAHRKTRNILLQLMDEGIVRDCKGTPLDFRKSILVCTSNVGLAAPRTKNASLDAVDEYRGAEFFRQRYLDGEISYAQMEDNVRNTFFQGVHDFFPSEFRGRFTKIVPFRFLSENDAVKVTHLELRRSIEHAQEAGVRITVDKPERLVLWILAQNHLVEGKLESVFADDTGARHIRDFVESALKQIVLSAAEDVGLDDAKRAFTIKFSQQDGPYAVVDQ